MKSAIRIAIVSGGLLAAAVAFGLDAAPAQAQMMAPPVYTQTYAYRPAYTYNQGVLPRFARRGGIGTTPYLGNTRGLGAYSYNYDRVVAPRATYAYPARGRWFRRLR